MMRHAPCCSGRDICMATYIQGKAPSEIPVSTAMSKGVFFTTPETTIREAEETMRAHKVRRLPVLNTEGQLIGIVSLNDEKSVLKQTYRTY